MRGLLASPRRAKIWVKAMRLPFLTATVVPVVLGTAIAWYQKGSFNLVYFLVTLGSVSLVHLGTNLTNDYYDHLSGNDAANSHYSPFNGGSRVIQDGQIPAHHILYAAVICFAGGMLLGIYLLLATQKVAIVLFGLAGILCGFFYTASPVRVGYHRLGELAVGFGFGPLPLLGSYWIQTFSFDLVAAMASVPVGFLILIVLLINEFPDYEADKAVGKETLVVSLGRRKAVVVYQSLLLLSYAFIVMMVLVKVFPLFCLAALLTLPIAYRAIAVSKRWYASYPELLPANAATIALHFLVGVCLTGGFVLSRLVPGLL
jgi:1,4-dihydroxy-2-naphthoate octaprenyltransferase